MDYSPKWTKEVEFSERALDPLGLSGISEYIVDKMLPGVTSLTTVGRNYSFYTWAIKQANSEKPSSTIQLRERIAQLEVAYVIAGILDKVNHDDPKGMIGEVKARNAIQHSDTDVAVTFSVLNNPGGGLWQYYLNSMARMDMLFDTGHFVFLTEKGNKMALAFYNEIKDTIYINNYINNESIPLDVLKTYGERCGYLRMKDSIFEKELLIDSLLSENQSSDFDPRSRRDTILLLLSLVEFYGNKGLLFNDEHFRNYVYYGCSIKDDHLILPSIAQKPNRIIKEWRLFQFHEFLTFALESILLTFIEVCKDDRGTTTNEFLALSKSNLGLFTKIMMGTEKNDVLYEKVGQNQSDSNGSNPWSTSIKEIVTRVLVAIGVENTNDKDMSVRFDKMVGINHELSERTIEKMVNGALKRNHGLAISGSMFLILVLMLRYHQYHDEIDEDTLWIRNKEESELLSLFALRERIWHKFDEMTLGDFFNLIINDIVFHHTMIANEKLGYGNDTFRFVQNDDGRYYFVRDFNYTYRNDRINSLTSIIEDLGLIIAEKGSSRIAESGLEVIINHGSEN